MYLEVLGCDNVENKDVGVGNKTDVMICCVYGDVIVHTDVVFDCLSPRFMPWTQRAFLFHIKHPSDLINIGIFDFGASNSVDLSNLIGDERIGQISIGISTLKPSTEYILHYDVSRDDSFSNKRKITGSISLRLRLEWVNERNALLSSLSRPESYRINVKKKASFQITRWTVNKECDTEAYSMNTITSRLDELYEYRILILYVIDGVESVFLWRSPLHSYERTVRKQRC